MSQAQSTTENLFSLITQQQKAAAEAIDAYREALEHLAQRVDDALELLACGHDSAAFEALRIQRDALLSAGFIRELPRAH